MLMRRIIACLDVADGVVVKGVRFAGHVVQGDVLDLARRYRDEGADELVFYDIKASPDGKRVARGWIERVAAVLDLPFCVAGGIGSVADARELLGAGADKISVNSRALARPALIDELARAVGTQSVVVGVDSRRVGDDWHVFQFTGRSDTLRDTGRRTRDWVREAQDRGAGEIVLNCMDHDGVRTGYDLAQLAAVRAVTRVPLVASGGAGTAAHFAAAFGEADVDGALAAGALHSGALRIPELKRQLATWGLEVRP